MTGAVEITLRDIYDAQQASRTEVATLGAKFDQLQATVNLKMADGERIMADHETRLRAEEARPKVTRAEFEALETRMGRQESNWSKLVGIGTVLMLLAGAASAVIEHLITH